MNNNNQAITQISVKKLTTLYTNIRQNISIIFIERSSTTKTNVTHTIITVHARHCRASVHLRRQAVTIPTAAGDRFTVVATCSMLSAVRTACLVVRVSVLLLFVASGYVRSSRLR